MLRAVGTILSPLAWWRWFLTSQDRVASRLALLAEGLSIARPPVLEQPSGASPTVRFERFSLWLRLAATLSAALLLLLLRPENLILMNLVVAAFGAYTLCIAR